MAHNNKTWTTLTIESDVKESFDDLKALLAMNNTNALKFAIEAARKAKQAGVE